MLIKENKGFQYFFQNPILVLLIVTIISHVLSIYLLGFKAVVFADTEGYVDLAIRLQDLDFIGYDFSRTPGYSLLLLLLGMQYKWVIAIQYVLNFISILLLYKIAKGILKNKKLLLFVSLIPSFVINYYFYERALLTETFSLFLFVLIVYLFCIRKETIFTLFYVGISCALLMMTRTLFLYLAPLITLLYFYENRKMSLVFLGKRIAVILAPTLLCFLIWSGLNKKHTGMFALTSFFGINLAQTSVGFIDLYEGKHTKVKDIYVEHIKECKTDSLKNKKNAIWYAYDELLLETGYNLPQLSVVLSEMSKQVIINNFDKYLYQVSISFKDFWINDLYWFIEKENQIVSTSFVFWRRTSRVFQLVLNLLFIVSFVYYSFKFLSSQEKQNRLISFLLLSIMSGSILQAMVVYGDNSRFSFPYYSMITLVAIYFMNDLWKKQLIKN